MVAVFCHGGLCLKALVGGRVVAVFCHGGLCWIALVGGRVVAMFIVLPRRVMLDSIGWHGGRVVAVNTVSLLWTMVERSACRFVIHIV